LRDAESLLDQLSLLPPPIEANAVWDLLGAVPEQELLALAQAMTSSEPVALLEATRNLLDRGRDPGAVLQGLAGVLRDLVLMAAAPNRPELTGVSPQFRDQLPELAKSIGRPGCCSGKHNCVGLNSSCDKACNPAFGSKCCCWGF
jgi:DNA polymerase-3 subunit gamma/tau